QDDRGGGRHLGDVAADRLDADVAELLGDARPAAEAHVPPRVAGDDGHVRRHGDPAPVPAQEVPAAIDGLAQAGAGAFDVRLGGLIDAAVGGEEGHGDQAAGEHLVGTPV